MPGPQIKRVTRIVLKINNKNFLSYILIYISLLIVNWIDNELLTYIDPTITWIFWFVIANSILKIIYSHAEIIIWIKRTIAWIKRIDWIAQTKNVKRKTILLISRSLSYLFFLFKYKIPTSFKNIEASMPDLIRSSFLWSLIVYLTFLLTKSLENTNNLWAITLFLGITTTLLNQKKVKTKAKLVIPSVKLNLGKCFLTAILAIGSAVLVYLNLKTFGILGLALTVISFFVIFLTSLTINRIYV